MFGNRKRMPVVEAGTDEAPKAEADQAPAKAEPRYVTQAQLNTLMRAFAAALAQVEVAASAPPGTLQSRLGYRLGLVARAPAEFGLSSAEASAFKRLVSLIDEASHNDSARERRRASNPDDSWRQRPPPI